MSLDLDAIVPCRYCGTPKHIGSWCSSTQCADRVAAAQAAEKLLRASDATKCGAVQDHRDSLLSAVDRVRALHRPENRYSDSSRDTAEEAAENGDIDVADVECWQVCSHCGDLEERNAGDAWDFLDAIWPCASIRALDGAS